MNEKHFFHAVNRGDIKLIQQTLDLGVDINLKNRYGETALMLAASCEDYFLVEFLVNNGADIDIRDNQGNNAIAIASLSNEEDSAMYQLIINLLNKFESDSKEFNKDKANGFKIYYKNYEKLKLKVKVELDNYLIKDISNIVIDYIQKPSFKEWIDIVNDKNSSNCCIIL